MSSPPDPHDSPAARLKRLLEELDKQTAAASDLHDEVSRGLARTHTSHALDDAARRVPGSSKQGPPDPDERG